MERGGVEQMHFVAGASQPGGILSGASTDIQDPGRGSREEPLEDLLRACELQSVPATSQTFLLLASPVVREDLRWEV
jgi:hypothetical protein